jgi:hypothetical protein
MWDPQRHTTLWAFTACYSDNNFIFFLHGWYQNNVVHILNQFSPCTMAITRFMHDFTRVYVVTDTLPRGHVSCYNALLTWASWSFLHSPAPEADAWSVEARSLQRSTPITIVVVQLTPASSPVKYCTQFEPTTSFLPSASSCFWF